MMKPILSTAFILFIFLATSNQSHAASFIQNNNWVNFQIELQHWKDVNKLIPRKAKFTVIDVESGKSFEVQRRAGTHHADVQPLTRKDTKIMKKIYHGHWSWRRRSILILAQDRLIAASMHGMPHGAGALQNGFNGHFCIHFIGSMTHRTERSDLSHQLMILKAAGKIDEYLANASSDQIADAFMVFTKNADKGLIKKVAISNKKRMGMEIKKIDAIETLRWDRMVKPKNNDELLISTIDIKLQLFIKEHDTINTSIPFQLVRESPISPWKINIDPLITIIEEAK
ncbi:hypothetical protein ACQKCU_17930 [Heyndrickxia sporothermodurans]